MPHRVFEFLRNGARVPIVIVAGPALLAVAVIAVVVALVQLRADALADTRRDIANLARVFAEQTGRSVQAVDLILRDLQDSIEESRARRSKRSVRWSAATGFIASWERRSHAFPRSMPSRLSIGTEAGNASRTAPNIGLDLSDREYFKHFSTHDDLGLFISVPTRNRITGIWTIYFSRRINSSRGDFLGLVLAAVPIQYFAEVFGSVDLPRRNCSGWREAMAGSWCATPIR